MSACPVIPVGFGVTRDKTATAKYPSTRYASFGKPGWKVHSGERNSVKRGNRAIIYQCRILKNWAYFI